jgi:pyridoxal phosphate enzyme (YggS family)
MGIAENIESVKKKINESCRKVNKNPAEIKLVVVTKTHEADEVNEAIGCGITCIGESKVQEAEDKFPRLSGNLEKHLIGHLQTNKVKSAVQLFDVIQSVDSLKLAKEIDKRCCDIGKIMPIFIEINIAGEESKGGAAYDEAKEFYFKIIPLKNIKVIGLMTIAPYVEPELTRPYFRKMKILFDELKLRWLSMGMSSDFQQAIEEGSNMVRIGTAIFKERK